LANGGYSHEYIEEEDGDRLKHEMTVSTVLHGSYKTSSPSTIRGLKQSMTAGGGASNTSPNSHALHYADSYGLKKISKKKVNPIN
jgi:hypothetical protein